MKFRLIVLAASLTLLLAACSLAEDITPPPGYVSPTPAPSIGQLHPANPPSPARGAVTYTEQCLPCHGENGLGNGPMAPQMPVAVPAIGLRDISSQFTPADWFTVISQGRKDRGMPSFLALSEQQRWDVLSFVYSLSATNEEFQQGATIYYGKCAACHGAQGRGDGSQAAGLNPAIKDLTNQQFASQATGTGLYRAVAEGVSPSMPAFGTQLTKDDLWAVVAYLRTLAFDQSMLTTIPQPSTMPASPPGMILPTSEAISVSTVVTPAPATKLGTAMTPEIVSATPVRVATLGVQTGTPAAVIGTVTGKVVTNAANPVPEGLTVTLLGFEHGSDATSTMQQVFKLTAQLQADGSYAYENVEMDPSRLFLVQVEYEGVTFESDYAALETGKTMLSLAPITLYDTSTDMTKLSLDQVHFQFDFSTTGKVQVVELYVLTNSSNKAVVITSDGTSVPFIMIPAGAQNINYQIAQGALFSANSGFAIAPSAEKYGIVASFDLPYDNKLEITQPFALTAVKVNLFVPEGMKASGGQLTNEGLQTIQSANYQMYSASKIESGKSLTFTITGKPGTINSTGSTSNNHTALVIGLGILGVVLIAVGIYLFLRDRRRKKDESDQAGMEAETGEDALGNDLDNITDAIIALDEQFKSGDISMEAYQKRRAAFKARLKELL